MKKCNRCGIEKSKSEFYSDKYKKDGLKYQCIKCHNAYNNKLRNKNPESYRKTNLEYARSERAKYTQRANQLRVKFWPHLTADEAFAEYEKLFKEQNECCALCGLHRSNFKFNFAVDHCHETKVVRGLLCNKCNRFEVGRHTLKTAAKLYEYILKTSKK